ncbi:epidermal growth factor-like protein 7 isoform X5 [Equus asinus]|uniref:Epidermal growth factor-like protein 7 n=2 Tax=Equus asinus TaxID=9793 RepID=A0A8C4MH17_EQUAS|nr:epidermal growth factor-like protein 7 isoform X3 [Equus asinus]
MRKWSPERREVTSPEAPSGDHGFGATPRGLRSTQGGPDCPEGRGSQGTLRRRPSHLETQAMWGSRELLLVWFLVLAVGGTQHIYRPGRRVCAIGVPRDPVSESFVQRVYQPFLTTCDGHRACSTYRTIYRTAYRRSPGPAPARPRYACCPGWKRTSGLPGACGVAVCQPPCQNGGVCVQPGRCHCPAGWRGDTCQTDVDECSAGQGGCPQRCVNTAGSYWCQCWEGHSPSADGAICLPKRGTARVPHPHPTTGVDSEVKEEVQRLRSRVDVLEQKLQLVLAPLHSLASRALEHGLPDPGSLLAHSFQQLDRIDSLSEQISFLEEQLGSCSCKKEL